MGPYNDQIMPALMLFYDKQGTCSFTPSRHFYDPTEQYPGEFQGSDFYLRRYFVSDSLMLRPGYRVILYEKKMWKG